MRFIEKQCPLSMHQAAVECFIALPCLMDYIFHGFSTEARHYPLNSQNGSARLHTASSIRKPLGLLTGQIQRLKGVAKLLGQSHSKSGNSKKPSLYRVYMETAKFQKMDVRS